MRELLCTNGGVDRYKLRILPIDEITMFVICEKVIVLRCKKLKIKKKDGYIE